MFNTDYASNKIIPYTQVFLMEYFKNVYKIWQDILKIRMSILK